MAKTQTKVFTGVRNLPMPDHAEIRELAVPIEFSSSAYASGDLIQVIKLPAGVRCVDWALNLPDIDSGGSPAIAWSLGVENTGGTDLGSEVWGSGLTAGQTTSIVRNSTNVSAQGDITADRNIDLKCTTIAATYAGSGTVGYLMLKLVG